MPSPYFENGRSYEQQPNLAGPETSAPLSMQDIFFQRIQGVLKEIDAPETTINPKDVLLPNVFATDPNAIRLLPRTPDIKGIQKPTVVIYSPSDRWQKLTNGNVTISATEREEEDGSLTPHLQVHLGQTIRGVHTPATLPKLTRSRKSNPHFVINHERSIPYGAMQDGRNEGIIVAIVREKEDGGIQVRALATTVPVGFRELFENGRMKEINTPEADHEHHQAKERKLPKPIFFKDDMRNNSSSNNRQQASDAQIDRWRKKRKKQKSGYTKRKEREANERRALDAAFKEADPTGERERRLTRQRHIPEEDKEY